MAEGAGWDAAPLMMQRAAGIYPSADQLLNVAQKIKSESERLVALETELNNHGISLKDQN